MLKIKRFSSIMFAAAMIFSCACPLGASAQSSVTSSSSTSQGTSTITSESALENAKAFVQLFYDGKFDTAMTYFDATAKSQLSAEYLKTVWDGTIVRFGTYQNKITAQSAEKNGMTYAILTYAYEYYNFNVTVGYDADGKIGAFYFSHSVNTDLAATTYTNGGIKEVHFNLTSGDYKLPAVLTMPASGGNFPAVVIVAGSGANDRDGTDSAEKPYKDIAEGLARKGIATLRYDKRTFAYQTQYLASGKISIDEEYTQDAVSAVNYLASYPGINSSKVYMLGHSEGGMLAPRISLSTPKVAGLILLAGSPRRLEDIIVDQCAEVDPSSVAAAKAQATKIKELDNLTKVPDETIAGCTASYWKDLDSQDAAKDAIKSGKPMLIMQGERDAQVFMTDFNLWKQKLSSLSNVVYKSYPKLNHLFIEGTGKPNLGEYKIAGHVASYAIDDIASFVNPAASSATQTAAIGASAIKPSDTSSALVKNPKTGGNNLPVSAAFALLAISISVAAFCLLLLSRRYAIAISKKK